MPDTKAREAGQQIHVERISLVKHIVNIHHTAQKQPPGELKVNGYSFLLGGGGNCHFHFYLPSKVRSTLKEHLKARNSSLLRKGYNIALPTWGANSYVLHNLTSVSSKQGENSQIKETPTFSSRLIPICQRSEVTKVVPLCVNVGKTCRFTCLP